MKKLILQFLLVGILLPLLSDLSAQGTVRRHGPVEVSDNAAESIIKRIRRYEAQKGDSNIIFDKEILLGDAPCNPDGSWYSSVTYRCPNGKVYKKVMTYQIDKTVNGKCVRLITTYGYDYPYEEICGSGGNKINLRTLEKVSTELNLYPNPSSSNVTIDFDLMESSNVSLSIINMLGQTVYTSGNNSYSEGQHKKIIDVSEFNNGTYFYNITINGVIEQGKFIVRH